MLYCIVKNHWYLSFTCVLDNLKEKKTKEQIGDDDRSESKCSTMRLYRSIPLSLTTSCDIDVSTCTIVHTFYSHLFYEL